MIKNRMLEKLRQGELVNFFWMSFGLPVLAEFVSRKRYFDSILLDIQHGYWNQEALLQVLQVIDPLSTVPLTRVARNDSALIGQVLDMGSLGVLVPLVNSPQEATEAVAAMRYPPLGRRSAGGARLALYGEDYITAANDEIACMVMLETREAVEQAEEILAVPGVDLGFVGPGDLALSLGCWPDKGPLHEAALLKVLKAGQKVGTPVGIACLSVEEALHRAQQGFRFVPCAIDFHALQQAISVSHKAFQAGQK